MLRITLDYREGVPLECPDLAPDRLAAMPLADISRLTIWQGNQKRDLAEMARIEGTAGDGHLRLEGDWGKVKWLGKGMAGGTLEILSDCGMHTGSGMKGGTLLVRGHASDWAGGEMRGGILRIEGSAGHSLGAGYPGARAGMRGGTILVGGDCGGEAGGIMRRGLIAVKGRAGAFAGVGMIAGTLVFGGGCGPRPGAAMKRGSIVCGLRPESVLPSFSAPVEDQPLWLTLLRNHLSELEGAPWDLCPTSDTSPLNKKSSGRGRSWWVTRGDGVTLGMGELLWPA